MPAPPAVVVAYLTALADGTVRVQWSAGRRGGQHYDRTTVKSLSTIRRALAAISVAHQTRGLDWPRRHPLIVECMQGIARTLGGRKRHKTPIEIERLAVCLAAYRAGTSLAQIRDRALALVGVFGVLRRSDAAALDLATDVDFPPEGLKLTIRRSKTNQTGEEPEHVAIHYQRDVETDPVRAMRAWVDALAALGIRSGSAFRPIDRFGRVGSQGLSTRSIAAIVKDIAEAGGFKPEQIGAHSLRSGGATTMGRKGKSLHAIMAQGRWTDPRTALGYIRAATLFSDNPTKDLT
ncbi:MAG: site-specific integrase [Polyangiales bacterium]